MTQDENMHWLSQELETHFASALLCGCALCTVWYRTHNPPRSNKHKERAYASFPHLAQTSLRRSESPHYSSVDDLKRKGFPMPYLNPRVGGQGKMI